jgi:uncharacterized membrane protein
VSHWSAPGVAALAAAWLLLVVAAPVVWTPLATLLYAAGSLICHQIPERSFHVQGSQLPVCARCAGLYGGGALGSVVAAAIGGRLLRRRRLPPISWQWIGTSLAALPTIATFVLEWVGGWHISNTTRAMSAVPLGGAVAFVVVRALATLHYDQCVRMRPIGSSRPPTGT